MFALLEVELVPREYLIARGDPRLFLGKRIRLLEEGFVAEGGELLAEVFDLLHRQPVLLDHVPLVQRQSEVLTREEGDLIVGLEVPGHEAEPVVAVAPAIRLIGTIRALTDVLEP